MKMRRAIAFALCLSLALLAASPISACGMLMKSPFQCLAHPGPARAEAEANSHCAAMAGGEEGAGSAWSASPKSCCENLSAPPPEVNAAKDKFSMAPQEGGSTPASPETIPVSTRAERRVPADARRDAAPLDLQPLLCIFLI
jgi:hypothetical protein